MDESQAITLLKQGQIGGLETLVRTYQVQALRAAFLITRDHPLAEDIVQAAFLRVYERIHQFDALRPFGPWFLRIVINDAIKAAARRERWVSLDDAIERGEVDLADLVADPYPGPEELIERAEVRQAVGDALGKLSPQQRAVIILRYYRCLPEAEIADRLGYPQGTIKWWLHDVRRRLRDILSIPRPGRVRDVPLKRTVLADFGPEAESGPTETGGKQ
ncbi:MAG: sigma-70 family RNA polymerase sigma factor [Chloroflexota bacterium]|nr:MAG: sigma-70 family RNA polymerase sigma factor [Chloroflexota bacterium]